MTVSVSEKLSSQCGCRAASVASDAALLCSRRTVPTPTVSQLIWAVPIRPVLTVGGTANSTPQAMAALFGLLPGSSTVTGMSQPGRAVLMSDFPLAVFGPDTAPDQAMTIWTFGASPEWPPLKPFQLMLRVKLEPTLTVHLSASPVSLVPQPGPEIENSISLVASADACWAFW